MFYHCDVCDDGFVIQLLMWFQGLRSPHFIPNEVWCQFAKTSIRYTISTIVIQQTWWGLCYKRLGIQCKRLKRFLILPNPPPPQPPPPGDLPDLSHSSWILDIGVTAQVTFIDHLDFKQHGLSSKCYTYGYILTTVQVGNSPSELHYHVI